MTLSTFGFIISGIFLNAFAQILLKAGSNSVGAIYLSEGNWWHIGTKLITQPSILGGLGCYVVSVVIWIIGLSRVNVTIAYPMLSLGYVINAVGAWYFLGETFSLQRALAIGIIIFGVALLVRS